MLLGLQGARPVVKGFGLVSRSSSIAVSSRGSFTSWSLSLSLSLAQLRCPGSIAPPRVPPGVCENLRERFFRAFCTQKKAAASKAITKSNEPMVMPAMAPPWI